ncbi:MAG: SDR family NAD(P)-dependent oxidoreductase [Comamonadaceae bacterium]|nr:MAG: SDR family NAD(P)-dependent oxidoreductase [Comamonadaceae bacterium]
MTDHLKPLADQVIVLTGASSGIGLCTARLAAERGARLVLVARSADVLGLLVSEINAAGGKAVGVVGDVAERDRLDEAARTALTTYGRIDTWINNAGVSIYGRLDEVSEADSRRLFDVNFWGVVHGSLAALPFLKPEGGALINVGSEVSDAVVPLQGMYSASKHAVKGFTDALRVELEDVDKSKVTVVLIQPTAVNTPFPEHAKNYMDKQPKLPDPMIDPTDVAEAILKAAVEGGRDVKVGGMSVLNTTMSKILPSLADKMSAKQVDRQQMDMAPKTPDGTLYQPGRAGRAHGQPVS